MTRIKEILKEKGMSVAELAELLGISRQALSKQIQGKMLVETAERIATALNVPLWQLFASPEETAGSTSPHSITCPHCGARLELREAENKEI